MEQSQSSQIPVLLIMFNRPEHGRRLLERLREVQPTSLYVAIDGPRPSHPNDTEQVAKSIALLDSIDWPCTLSRLIRDQNKGCKHGVSSAINWFFSHVEEGIILEDDCLPDPTFFSFCSDLLNRYRHTPQVMHISGANLTLGQWWSTDSYLFTKVCHIWGWASWRRAWQHYDVMMADYPAQQQSLLKRQVDNLASRPYWKHVFDEAYTNKVDTWDYQWVYSIWKMNGLCILPKVNLITNIGFDSRATHTKLVTKFADLPTGNLTMLQHPTLVADNKDATNWLFNSLYTLPSTLAVWLEKVKRRIPLIPLLKKW